LESEIDALAKEIEEYKIIQSIPGIGEQIEGTIISEIGEIETLKTRSIARVVPEGFESGKFKATLVRITIQGQVD
jgi:transposase